MPCLVSFDVLRLPFPSSTPVRFTAFNLTKICLHTSGAYSFAKKFNLRQYINFRTKVEKLQRCPKSGKWKVSFKRNRYSPHHRAYPDVEPEDPNVCAAVSGWGLCPFHFGCGRVSFLWQQ